MGLSSLLCIRGGLPEGLVQLLHLLLGGCESVSQACQLSAL